MTPHGPQRREQGLRRSNAAGPHRSEQSRGEAKRQSLVEQLNERSEAGEDVVAAVCAPDHWVPAPGSGVSTCDDCGGAIWIHDSHARNPDNFRVCFPCAAPRVAAGEIELTEETRLTMRRLGWTDADLQRAQDAAITDAMGRMEDGS